MSQSEFRFLSSDEEAQVKAAYGTLSEKDKRRFAASLSLAFPYGGCGYVVKLLGCSRATLTRGRKELRELKQSGDPAAGRVRREGAGRPKKEEAHPELPGELDNLLEERTAGDPKDDTVSWTFLTIAGIARLLSEVSVAVSWPVTKRLCLDRDLKKRHQVNSVTKAPSRGRDEQFSIIDRLRGTFRREQEAIFSIDSKQKELLGNVSRPGQVLADGPVEMLDHALPSYADGEVVSHGIYDTQHNTAHINLSLGHDTGAFACASFLWYWRHVGRLVHTAAERVLLLMDCGGSNSFRSNTFKYNLSLTSSTIGLPIQVAHYPVYCSKYNPIERRVFPWVERAYSGQNFTTVEQMAESIEQMASTSTGLVTTAHVLKEEYQPATEQEKNQAASVDVEYPENLDDYNYRVTPQITQ